MTIKDVSEIYSMASDIIKFIHILATDYVNAIPEAKEFSDKCDMYFEIAEKYNNSTLKIHHDKIKEYIEEVNDKAKKIINNSSKEKNLLGKTLFNIELLTKAGYYRKYFSEKSELISKELKNIGAIINIMAPEPPVKLPTLAKIFWNDNFEDKKSVPWETFSEKYSFYQNLSEESINVAKKYLCVNNCVTIYAFYATCSQLGYPIMIPIQPQIDTMKLAELVMELNKEFYSFEFGKHWNKMRKLENESESEEDLYNKLKKLCLSKEDKDIEYWKELNISRSIVSSFFQRYMMLWRIGRISQEMLDNIDFPGKARMKIFNYSCGTIDHVNYTEYLKLHLPSPSKKEKLWEEGKPQVYDFINQLLKDEKDNKKDK